jgi:Zn finger protein HypA/HybF involved in hydrogenase expression
LSVLWYAIRITIKQGQKIMGNQLSSIEEIPSYIRVECFECNGAGDFNISYSAYSSPDDHYTTCPKCHGEGKVDYHIKELAHELDLIPEGDYLEEVLEWMNSNQDLWQNAEDYV